MADQRVSMAAAVRGREEAVACACSGSAASIAMNVRNRLRTMPRDHGERIDDRGFMACSFRAACGSTGCSVFGCVDVSIGQSSGALVADIEGLLWDRRL